jgi:hypothetical protein
LNDFLQAFSIGGSQKADQASRTKVRLPTQKIAVLVCRFVKESDSRISQPEKIIPPASQNEALFRHLEP